MICKEDDNSSKNKVNLSLPIISIVLSVIGIIGFWVVIYITQKLSTSSDFAANIPFETVLIIYHAVHGFSMLSFYIAILIAIISLYKQKSLISFLVGIIPCVYLIIVTVFQNLPPIFKYLWK